MLHGTPAKGTCGIPKLGRGRPARLRKPVLPRQRRSAIVEGVFVQATTGLLPLPHIVDDDQLPRRAADRRFADVVADAYVAPDAVVMTAARAASHCVTLLDHRAVVGFAFVRVHQTTMGRAAHLSLIGSNPAYRLGSVTLTLLSVCDDLLRSRSVAAVWTTTCHPTALRIWGRHFAVRELDARAPEHAPLARELWRSIGADASADPWLCRGGFPREYTDSELALIARTIKTFPGPCSTLDVVGGDRLLLLARP